MPPTQQSQELEHTAKQAATTTPGSSPATHATKGPAAKAQEVAFAPPGEGPWEADGTHFPRPLTRFAGARIAAGFQRGFRQGSDRYGLPVAVFATRLVNQFVYMQPVPFGASHAPARRPPKIVFQLLTRLHPAMRRRIKTSADAFERRVWREDLARWDAEVKPALLRAHRAIQSVDVAALDNESLAKHLVRCADHLEEMHCQRHRHSVAALLAVGDFVAQVHEWTGLPFGDVVLPLKGASPVSNGIAARELDALGAALRADADALRILEAPGSPAATLAELAARKGPVSEALAAYLDLVGYRSVGYDIADHFALEMPDVLVKTIRSAAHGGPRGDGDGDAGQAARTARLRDAVPAAMRPRFDQLLEEARHMYRLRDERAVYTDTWACGLARRAVLAAGAKLAAAGTLDAAEQAIDASCEELTALLRGRPGPSREELTRRAQWRKTKTVADIPAHLGGTPAGPPPEEWLPLPARRTARALRTFLACMFGGTGAVADVRPEALSGHEAGPGSAVGPGSEQQKAPASVKGLSVSPGIYEGTARLIADASEFGRINAGDILVTRSTSPYFNVVLPLLGAVVTDRGGQLCHAAIIAREYGIPGVVGTGNATKVIRDGARIRVDGARGEVEVL